MFKTQVKKECKNTVEKVAFEAAIEIIHNLMITYDLSRFVRDERHLQKMLDSKFFLKKDEKEFKNFADQNNVKYGGIVYIIRPIKSFCISPGIIEEIYIGVTWKSLLERFIEHTEDAIN